MRVVLLVEELKAEALNMAFSPSFTFSFPTALFLCLVHELVEEADGYHLLKYCY